MLQLALLGYKHPRRGLKLFCSLTLIIGAFTARKCYYTRTTTNLNHFLLNVQAETNGNTLAPIITHEPCHIAIQCVQWQLDATMCLLHQLLRSYEATVSQLARILDKQRNLLASLQDADEQLLVNNRDDWNTVLSELQSKHSAVLSGLTTLRQSVETAFVCEDLSRKNVSSVLVDQLPGCQLSSKGSQMLHFVEKEFDELHKLSTLLLKEWPKLLSEHIRACKTDSS